MANFAVAASSETIERANRIMELYAQEGDKKEDILIRILSLAENESIRGTHPELESSLRAVDSTISTLIKQINGVVAGQDVQLTELKEKLEYALEEKRIALETSKEQIEAAEVAIKKATIDTEMIKKQAQEEIKTANAERDQAIRERNDARTIAEEKTASNDLLMRQMAAMEQDVIAYEELKKNFKQLQEDYSSIQGKLIAAQKDSEKAMIDFSGKLEMAKAQEALAVEKAVIAKERELQELIRQADKENAKLQAKIEQLQVNLIPSNQS